MTSFELPESVARAGLGALKAVALADGTLAETEARLLRAAAQALGLKGDTDVRVYEPDEVAASVTDPAHRERVVQGQIVMAIMDEKVSPEELAVIRRYAAALGVDDRRVHDLQLILGGHSALVKLDLMRKSNMFNDVVDRAWKEEGLRGVYAIYGGFMGLAQDPALASRMRAYGQQPLGTLGRAYHDAMVTQGFAFPGEKNGFPLRFRKHDLSHILGDYGIDPIGECEVIAFITGFNKSDPFGYLFMILVHMHLGIDVFSQETFRGTIDPERILAALARGAQVNQDLYDPGFDWEPLMPLTVDEVRRKLNVVPKA
jgi:uncharacterized tellurite resistance protein B-like protein